MLIGQSFQFLVTQLALGVYWGVYLEGPKDKVFKKSNSYVGQILNYHPHGCFYVDIKSVIRIVP